ncbi:hypothetical protein LJR098_000018 [Rhizobium sp. LjRoot98]|uniref:hypothetical protein n=1 Tax=unclassified Rhizobium TaxID=2613769 RepID=UPI000713BB8F|nr:MULTISPECIES: hypothetical protein [unclassified Rhizobium]KQV40584.1 hypothetical protein ASC96_19005 [Rhizobium sp. Root1204]KQX98632.1 hypothetical protein ASD36_21155 [Rhizobium sp. Root1334]KRC10543.1 hypothetical protein ASE23_23530 [Rhizobium sp. Root73]
MRRFLVAAALVAIPTISLAATSQADSTSRQRYNDFYYKSYDTAFEPVCVIRTVRKTDEYGNRVIRKIRICR